MSEQNVHYETLGLTEASSFEEVQAARKRLVAEHKENPKQKESIEAAYDAILMERLRLRQEGKIKVPDRIRFAEKQAKPKISATPISGGITRSSPQWFSDLLDQPESSSELLWPSVIFGVLAALSWIVRSPAADAATTAVGPTDSTATAAVALALGMMAAVYFLNQKTRKLWRAAGLSTAGLVVGLGLGLLIEVIFQSQGTELGAANAASLSASITLGALWFITGFLR